MTAFETLPLGWPTGVARANPSDHAGEAEDAEAEGDHDKRHLRQHVARNDDSEATGKHRDNGGERPLHEWLQRLPPGRKCSDGVIWTLARREGRRSLRGRV